MAVQHAGNDMYSHTIVIPERGYILPLELVNAKSSLLIRRPAKEEMDTCERVEVTARNEWDPQSPTLVEMENIAIARRKYFGDAGR